MVRSDWPLWLVAVAGFVCAGAVVADSIYLTVHFFQPLFIDDSWETVKGFAAFKNGTYELSDLVSQHNEHRLAVPRLVFFADFVVGRGLNIFNVTAVYLIQTVHAALLVAMASHVSRGAVLAIASAAIVVLLFSFGQSDNLTFGFQVQFVGVYAAATAAFFATAVALQPGASRPTRLAAMAGAAFAATVAAYMMSNGLLSVLVMVALAIVMRAGKMLVMSTVVFAATILFAYLHGAHFDHAPSPSMALLQRLVVVAAYFLVYLGGVAGGFGVMAAGFFGGVGLTLAIMAAARLTRARNADAACVALVGIMAFVLGTAAVTAWGRFGFGVAQALESRYMTPSSVFWAAQVVYWGSFAGLGERRLSRAFFVALACATIVSAIARHVAQRPSAQWNYMAANLGTDALLSGVFAPQAVKTIYPDPPTVERLAHFLSRERLNVFAWPEARWHGRRLQDVFPMRDDRRCEVVLDKLTRLDAAGDVAVEGWAWDNKSRSPVQGIVLVGPDQTIVGLGSGGWWRPDFRTLPAVENAEPGWKGFADSGDLGSLRPYAVLDHGKVACGGR